ITQCELAVEYLRGFNQKDYKIFLKLIDSLIINNLVSNDKKEELIINMGLIFYKTKINSQCHFPTDYYLGSAEKPQNYRKNKFLISSWNKTYNNSMITQENIQFFTTYATLNLNELVSKTNVLFLFSGLIVEKRIIKTMLKNALGDKVEIHENSNNTIKYDCIITNYQLLNTEVPVIYFSGKLTENDITSIRKYIF
ncbi:hypothetical protein OCB72_29030, partial [Bacillus cereus]|nr:hypothetical protein [Bacillus cereus]